MCCLPYVLCASVTPYADGASKQNFIGETWCKNRWRMSEPPQPCYEYDTSGNLYGTLSRSNIAGGSGRLTHPPTHTHTHMHASIRVLQGYSHRRLNTNLFNCTADNFSTDSDAHSILDDPDVLIVIEDCRMYFNCELLSALLVTWRTTSFLDNYNSCNNNPCKRFLTLK